MQNTRKMQRAVLLALLLMLFVFGIVSAVGPELDNSIFLPLIERSATGGSIPGP
jgi:hypothetical protein